MTVAVKMSATVTGHRRRGVREHDLVLELPPGEVTARQLIEAAVTAEVAAYAARAEEAGLVRVLTREALASDLARGTVHSGGTVRSGGVAPPPPPSLPASIEAAQVAFGDGIFRVFVGDRELAGGADTAPVADGDALLFLRLVPLAGG